MLICLNKFKQVRNELHLRNNELFTAYSKTLKAAAQPSWEAHVSQVERTTENFDTYLHTFITTYTQEGSFEKFQEYFVIVCKSGSLSVQAMHARLTLLNHLSLYLAKTDGTKPSEDEIFTPDQVKQYWAQSMPNEWIQSWKDIHPGTEGDFNKHTLNTLLNHFKSRETQEHNHKETLRRLRASHDSRHHRTRYQRGLGRGGRTY
jgi:hypothetical protein